MQLISSRDRCGRLPIAVPMLGALVVATTVLVFSGVACEPSKTPKRSVHRPEEAARSEGGDFVNTVGSRMTWVQPGTFLMGFQRGATDNAASPGLLELERPREVSIQKGFWISSTEVTVDQYAHVVGKSSEGQAGTQNVTESLPARNVSWRDAIHFCELLSLAERKKYRLPTTEEWEFACRGGAASSQQGRASIEELTGLAWFCDNSGNQVHPVAKLRPNALGLYDMQGNVFEWCMTKVPQHLLAGTPYEGQDCAFIRGGSYHNAGSSCDCGSTYGCEPVDHKSPAVGFRIVIAP